MSQISIGNSNPNVRLSLDRSGVRPIIRVAVVSTLSGGSSGGAGLVDGDYGDIVVSGTGTTMEIESIGADVLAGATAAGNGITAGVVGDLLTFSVDETQLDPTLMGIDIGATVQAWSTVLDELAALGGSFTNGYVITWNGTGFVLSAAAGGVSDGDKGDITVSGGGTVFTIDAGTVTSAKIAGNIAFNKMATVAGPIVMGVSAGSGGAVSPEPLELAGGLEITLDMPYTLQIADNGILNAKLYSAALQVLGGLTPAASKIPYFTGGGSGALLTLDTDSALTASSNTNVPSQKAVKDYVDALALNLGKRATVRTKTTANNNLAAPGANIDGTAMVAGDLFLAGSQTAPAENGIYMWNGAAVAATRTVNFDTYNEHPGALIAVQEGSTLADTIWICTSNAGGVLNTTAISFSKLNIAGELFSANNLSDLGNVATARGNLGLGTIAVQDAATVAITGGSITNLTNATGFSLQDVGTTKQLFVTANETLTANRTLSIITGDANRTLTFTASASIGGTNTGDQTITLTGDVTGTGTGAFAATIANGAVTTVKLAALAVTTTKDAIGGLSIFGSGADGDATISSGTTTLTRDMYYHNLTLSGTGKIAATGYRIFVSGILDITAAAANAISFTAGAGGNAAGATGGSLVTLVNGNTIGGNGIVSTAGATATTGAGSQGGAVSSPAAMNGGRGGGGGAGGSGDAGAGGAVSNTNSITGNTLPIAHLTEQLIRGTALVTGGQAGRGGSSGSGNSVATGGGGGGGGGGACVVYVAAQTINRGGSTPASCISAIGGAGGSGGTTGASGNVGGGAGGGAGAGGWIVIVFENLTGSLATNALDASGGVGGAGGKGNGTGTGGQGGAGGDGGRIDIFNLIANTLTKVNGVTGSPGTSGSGPSGVNGGAGGAAVTAQSNL